MECQVWNLEVTNDEAGIRIIDKSDKARILLATRKDAIGMRLQNAEGSLSIVAAVANDPERDPGKNQQRPRLELHDHTAKESLYIQDNMQ